MLPSGLIFLDYGENLGSRFAGKQKQLRNKDVDSNSKGPAGVPANESWGRRMAAVRLGGSAVAARVLLFGTAAALQLIAAAPAGAGGFYLQEQSVRGWGRANSGEVADTGPGSLWWNPAAIAGIESSEAAFGLSAIVPSGRVSDDGTLIDRPAAAPAAVGGAPQMRNSVLKGVLPTNAAALRVSDRLALGLAVSSPFSFTSDYDEEGWQRYLAIRTRLLTLNFQPSVAYAATDWLRVGAGANIVYSDAYLSNALPNVARGSPDGRFIIEGSGWQVGWSAGVQIVPAERVTLGVAYKSGIDHKQVGTTQVRGLEGPLAGGNLEDSVIARFSTPWQLILGARAGIGEATTLNVQAVHFGWSEFDTLDIGAPHDTFILQDYKDTWSFAAGVDHAVSERLTLRAGVQIDGTPARDAPRPARAGRRSHHGRRRREHAGQRPPDAGGRGVLYRLRREPDHPRRLFYAGTPAETRVLGNGIAQNQRALVLSLGGRMKF